MQALGAEVWTDQGIGWSEDWFYEIDKRLTESDVIMLSISPVDQESHWAQIEMGYALGRSKEKGVVISTFSP